MNALNTLLFNRLPAGQPTAIPSFMVLAPSAYNHDRVPQVIKKLPSGQLLGKYTNDSYNQFWARYGTNGPTGPGFCQPTLGSPCPNDVTPDVFIGPRQSIFVIQGQTRWVPVRPQDEILLFHPQNGLAVRNPLATTEAAGLEEDQTLIETLTETAQNASPLMKVAAVVTVAALAWYLIK